MRIVRQSVAGCWSRRQIPGTWSATFYNGLTYCAGNMGLFIVGAAMYERFTNDDTSGTVVAMLILLLEVIIGPPLGISVLDGKLSYHQFCDNQPRNYRSWLASNTLRVLLLTAIMYGVDLLNIAFFRLTFSEEEEVKGLTTDAVYAGLSRAFPLFYMFEWLAKYLLISMRRNMALMSIEGFRIGVCLITLYEVIEKEKVRDSAEYEKFIWLFNLRSIAFAVPALAWFLIAERQHLREACQWELALQYAWRDFKSALPVVFSVAADTVISKALIFVGLFGALQKIDSISAVNIFDLFETLVLLASIYSMQFTTQFAVIALFGKDSLTVPNQVERYHQIKNKALTLHAVFTLFLMAAIWMPGVSDTVAYWFGEIEASENQYLSVTYNWFIAAAVMLGWGVNNIYEGVTRGLNRKKGVYAAINVVTNATMAACTWIFFAEVDGADVRWFLHTALVTYTASAVAAVVVERSINKQSVFQEAADRRRAAQPVVLTDSPAPSPTAL